MIAQTRFILAAALFSAAVFAQEGDDDGSYNAAKYENPYAYSEQAAQQPQYQPQPQYQQQPQYQPQPQYQQQPQYQPQQQYRPQPQYQAQPQYAPATSVNGLPQTSTNYRTQDHERLESVDGQGNVRGQYSYVDPNGKTITVKYTAGKDGFQVEGDHLPRAPAGGAPAPAAPQYQPAPQYQQAPQYRPAPQQYQPAPQQYRSAAPIPNDAAQFLNSPLQHRFGNQG